MDDGIVQFFVKTEVKLIKRLEENCSWWIDLGVCPPQICKNLLKKLCSYRRTLNYTTYNMVTPREV